MIPAQAVAASALARAAIADGRNLLDRGQYRAAESTFARALTLLDFRDSAQTAEAEFGRAFSVQQRIITGDTGLVADGRDPAGAAIASFRRSASFLPQRYSAAANNNIAVMFRTLGQPDSAIRYFAAAASQTSPERTTYLLNTGRQFEATASNDRARSDSAAQYYSRALQADTTNAAALQALMSLQLRGGLLVNMLRSGQKWANDSACAGVVATMMSALASRDSANAAPALATLVAALPVARMIPSTFELSLRGNLLDAARVHPDLRSPINAVVAAYARPTNASGYVPSGNERWWYATDDLHRSWSSLLRWLGDTYNAQNDERIAQSYYLAAIGGMNQDLNATWVDRSALLPLALIFAEQPEGSAGAAQLDALVDRLFNAKGGAIMVNDVPRIYDYHLTLGALYAAKGKWTGPGAANAEYQLEHLRIAARQLSQDPARSSVPPHLLEALAIHYQDTKQTAKATDVKQNLRADLVKRGQARDADSVIARIERPAVPRTAKPAAGVLQRVSASRVTAPAQQVAVAAVSGRAASALAPLVGRVLSSVRSTGIPAHVWLVQGKQRQSVPVDSSGNFTVMLPTGVRSATLHVEANGYTSADVPVKSSSVSPLKITLRPKVMHH